MNRDDPKELVRSVVDAHKGVAERGVIDAYRAWLRSDEAVGLNPIDLVTLEAYRSFRKGQDDPLSRAEVNGLKRYIHWRELHNRWEVYEQHLDQHSVAMYVHLAYSVLIDTNFLSKELNDKFLIDNGISIPIHHFDERRSTGVIEPYFNLQTFEKYKRYLLDVLEAVSPALGVGTPGFNDKMLESYWKITRPEIAAYLMLSDLPAHMDRLWRISNIVSGASEEYESIDIVFSAAGKLGELSGILRSYYFNRTQAQISKTGGRSRGAQISRKYELVLSAMKDYYSSKLSADQSPRSIEDVADYMIADWPGFGPPEDRQSVPYERSYLVKKVVRDLKKKGLVWVPVAGGRKRKGK